MPRRREVPKREILPDPKHKSEEVAKFMNVLMTRGKKSVAERILYGNLQEGPFTGRKVISRIPATHGAALTDGSVYTFAVANRDLKFFDPKTEKRTTPKRLPS